MGVLPSLKASECSGSAWLAHDGGKREREREGAPSEESMSQAKRLAGLLPTSRRPLLGLMAPSGLTGRPGRKGKSPALLWEVNE